MPPPAGPSAADRAHLTVLGVAIDDLDVDEAVAAMLAAAKGPGRRTLYFANAHTLNHAAASDDYRRILNDADLLLGDGTGVRWAARVRGRHIKANLNGTDLLPVFLRATRGERLSLYLLGATPRVVARTAAIVGERFPGWTIAGHHHGYLDAATTEAAIAAINAAAPHLLLVAMGNPLQERWIDAHRARLDVNLCAGVGGLFAYLSGEYRRAPAWMRRLGLEWLGVMVLQPRKIGRYLRGNPLFLWRVAGEALGRRTRRGVPRGLRRGAR